MGTLGCINDMLRRDKENRELRKRNRERMTETRNRLMDMGKETDYSQMTPENWKTSGERRRKRKNWIKPHLISSCSISESVQLSSFS